MNPASIEARIAAAGLTWTREAAGRWRCESPRAPGCGFVVSVEGGSVSFAHALTKRALSEDEARDLLYACDQLNALKLAVDATGVLKLVFTWPLARMHEELFRFTLEEFAGNVHFVRTELPEFAD